jgi:hypothetical protein
MFKIITIQSVAAVASAAFLAGTIVLLTSVAPPANAMQSPVMKNSPPSAEHSVPTLVTVVTCSAHSWPHYAQSCLRRSAGDTRQVRVIDLIAR